MRLFLIVVATLIAGCGVHTKTILSRDGPSSFQSHTNRVCLLAGDLPSEFKFQEIGRIISTKRTYGGTDQVLAAIANQARHFGADAVVKLKAGQRFKGPLPWRVTSPVGDGIAVKLTEDSPKLDCAAAGGNLG